MVALASSTAEVPARRKQRIMATGLCAEKSPETPIIYSSGTSGDCHDGQLRRIIEKTLPFEERKPVKVTPGEG